MFKREFLTSGYTSTLFKMVDFFLSGCVKVKSGPSGCPVTKLQILLSTIIGHHILLLSMIDTLIESST